MPRVVALYRYPVKGFTPERCERLTVLDNGRIAGDRALAFRFGDSQLPEEAWSRKHGFTVLVNTPGLARLGTRFDPEKRRLKIELDGTVIADERLDEAGRRRLEAAVERYVLPLADNPLAGHAERRPLRLIGDGMTARYQDSEQGQVTLHSRESLAALAAALHAPTLDEVRFRSNIAIEGVSAWEEQDWIGRRVRIGSVELDVARPKTRCLATHANPRSGERDLAVMQTLVKAFSQREPTFAVAMMTHGRGGDIRVGDAVEVVT
jgi:uncharacterized protein YcbX